MELIIVLALAGMTYTWGWWRLRRRTAARMRSKWQAGATWRPVAYVSGLILLGLALMSPIDVLASQLFSMHMVQHLLLVMIVPPLLLIANPLPFFLWGLPVRLRFQTGMLFRQGSGFRRFLQKTTSLGLVWMYFVIVYLGWHDPNAYNAALERGWVHDLEHLTFFATAVLFWWHVIGAGPRIHRPLSPVARLAFLLSIIPVNMLAGMSFAFASQPIYSYYEAVPRLWGISVLADQQLAGVIMWIPGSMMYILAALILAGRWLQDEEAKPALPEAEWATDDALAAPSWEK